MLKHNKKVGLARSSKRITFIAIGVLNSLTSIVCIAQSVSSIEANNEAGQVVAYCNPANVKSCPEPV